ncbi:Blastula protease 10 [Nymphon striatum]|nr:Blastula protease 10 [Nymphon striatum]
MVFGVYCRAMIQLVIFVVLGISNAHKSFILNDSVPVIYKEHDVLKDNSKWLVEGDILTPLDRSDLPHAILYWDDAVLRYEYNPNVNAVMRKLVRRSMQDWSDGTCIQFYQTTSGERITIESNANEGVPVEKIGECPTQYGKKDPRCYSTIGRPLKSEKHILNLESDKCSRIGLITHELGHSLGLLHEHNRPDRDDYVQIINEETQEGTEENFMKYNSSLYGVEYDYLSAFARRYGKNTLITKDWKYTYLSGQRHRISFGDYKMINMMYNCSARNNCSKDLDCGTRGGYIGPTCCCVCPPETSGTHCEVILNSKHPLLCGDQYTTEQFIETPKYKGTRTMEEYCLWKFTAPKGKRVKVTFQEFDFLTRYSGRCVYEWVEFRNGDNPIGEFKCGDDFKQGESVLSTNETFSILINPYGPYDVYGKGFKAQVTFI